MDTLNDVSNTISQRSRKKVIRRFVPIFLNGIRTVLTPLIFIVFSYLIVRYHSRELWGGFVDYLLFFYLASLISNWGSKDYLSRLFSESPSEIIPNWQAHFTIRIPLLLVTIAAIFLSFKPGAYGAFIIWLCAGYINNAFIPVYTYKRDFGKVILTELSGLLLLVYLILANSKTQLSVPDLVYFYALHQLFKSVVYSLLYWRFFLFKRFPFDYKIILLSLPFFFMGCAGFLQSKVDLYVLGFFHDDALLGDYQIISGFFVFTQSIATLVLLPYLKNIYRMKSISLNRIRQRMITIGFVLNSTALLSIALVLHFFFNIQLSIFELLAGFFMGWPSYVYVLNIFYLFKNKMEREVLKICVFSLCINLILSLVLLSLDMETLGVLTANAVAQLVAMSFYLGKKIDDDLFKEIK